MLPKSTESVEQHLKPLESRIVDSNMSSFVVATCRLQLGGNMFDCNIKHDQQQTN